jgi:hypothetical protein
MSPVGAALGQVEELGCACGKARGGRGLRTMTHHEDLAEADRLIADCVDRIARQRQM